MKVFSYLFILFSLSCNPKKNEKKQVDYFINNNYSEIIDSLFQENKNSINSEILSDSITKYTYLDSNFRISGKMKKVDNEYIKYNWWNIKFPNNEKLDIQFLIEDGKVVVNQMIFYNSKGKIIKEKSKYYIPRKQIINDTVFYNIKFNSFHSKGEVCKGSILYAVSNNKKIIIDKTKLNMSKTGDYQYETNLKIPIKPDAKQLHFVALLADQCQNDYSISQNVSMYLDTIN